MKISRIASLVLLSTLVWPCGAGTPPIRNPFATGNNKLIFPTGLNCSSTSGVGGVVVVGNFTGKDDIVLSAPDGSSAMCPAVFALTGSGYQNVVGLTWNGANTAGFGKQLFAADLTGDGRTDLTVSAPKGGAASDPNQGAIYFLNGWNGVPCALGATDPRTDTCGALVLPGPYPGGRVGLRPISRWLEKTGKAYLAVLSSDEAYLYDMQGASTAPVLTLQSEMDSGGDVRFHPNVVLGTNSRASLDGPDLLLGAGSGEVWICSGTVLQAALDAGNSRITALSSQDDALCDPPVLKGASAAFSASPLTGTSSTVGFPNSSEVHELTATDSSTETSRIPVGILPAGSGTAVAAVDLDGDGVPERIISAVSADSTTPSQILILWTVGPADHPSAYQTRLVYSDEDEVEKTPAPAGASGTRLGTALAVLPDACERGGAPDALPAPGLLIGAPGAPDYSTAGKAGKTLLPPLLLVCPQEEIDWDGDSFMLSSDCNDQDDSVHPAAMDKPAPELCDGLDNDCDGSVDEGSFFIDGDGDGYGGALFVGVCLPDLGIDLSSEDGDCDDTNDAIYPGAVEACDGLDDNCDTVVPVDEMDKDNDAYSICNGDCDDTSTEIYPQAAEICGDGDDQDCNGADRDCSATDGDNDNFTPDQGDCNDYDDSIYPSATELCDGIDQDCDGVSDLYDGFDLDHDGTLDCYDDDRDGLLECLPCTTAPGSTPVCPTFDEPTPEACDCNDTRIDIHPGAPEGQVYDQGILAADGVDNDCDGQVDEGTGASDDDGDGFCELFPCLTRDPATGQPIALIPGDCNDQDVSIYPEAAEGEADLETGDMIGDGRDNDCDGLIDEGTTAYDDDGDGFCELDAGSDVPSSCIRRSDGVMPVPGDCDDLDPRRSPGLSEGDTQDGLDNDCDGTSDNHTLAFDDDGDGFCERGPCLTVTVDDQSFTPLSGDCEDQDPQIWPGAEEEQDGLDNDCNGLIDDGTAAYDDDGDGFCELDDSLDQQCIRGLDGVLPFPGDCDDQNGSLHPQALEIACDGINQDCDQAGLDGPDLDGNGIEDSCDHDQDTYSEDGGMGGAQDCDDTNAQINPGAPEACDGKDNNCDHQIDEGVGWCYPGCSSLPGSGSTPLAALILFAPLLRLTRLRGRWSGTDPCRPLLTGIVLVALLLNSGAARAETCTLTLDERTLEASLKAVQQSLARAEYGNVRSRALETLELIPCLEARIEVRKVASLHYSLGLAAWYQGRDEEESRRRFREALTLDPGYPWDERQQVALRSLFTEEWDGLRLRARVNLEPGWHGNRTVWVDGRPLAGVIPLIPGRHLVQSLQNDRGICTAWLSVPAVSGQDARRALRFENGSGTLAQCQEVPVLTSKPPWPRSRVGWIVTGAGLVASVASAIELQGDYDELARRAAAGGFCRDDENQAPCDDFGASQIRSWTLIGGTILAGSITIWLQRSESRQFRIETTAGPDGLRTGLAGTF